MGESFQMEAAWVKVFRIIPEFKILRLKVSHKMLNWRNYNRFSYLYTVCLKTIGHLNMNRAA